MSSDQSENCNVGVEYETGHDLAVLADRFFDGRTDHIEHPSPSLFSILLTHHELQTIVRLLAARLNRAFAGQRVAFVALLNGAFRAASDLLRHIDGFEYTISFVRVSFYGKGSSVGGGSGDVSLHGLSSEHTAGRHVVLLDELIDTGTTLMRVQEHLDAHRDEFRHTGVSTAVVLAKPDALRARAADYVGFDITPSLWLVGYGLDDAFVVRGWDVLTAKMVMRDAEDYWAKMPSKLTEGKTCPSTKTGVFQFWRNEVLKYLAEHANELPHNRYLLE